MKIDRLIGILAILLQSEKVTAPFLAEKFEVTRRTINRDIEDLCKAGIPVVTMQGKNGGISIMEGYRMDRTLLTSSDMQSILAGLRSLHSVSGTNRLKQLMEKLAVGNSEVLDTNHQMSIDLSSWYKDTLSPKIELIQNAISSHEKIAFAYFAPTGESKRKIESYQLVFKWSSWYVWGYCSEKEDFRLFKLNRMMDLQNTLETYQPRTVKSLDLSSERLYPSKIKVKALFEPQMRWRLIEEYGADSFTEQENGKLLFSSGFMDKDSLFGWLLSFADQVELAEPQELRTEFLKAAHSICKKYQQ